MDFVSLGSFCSVRRNIDLYAGQEKKPTLFFDWLHGHYNGLILFLESKEFFLKRNDLVISPYNQSHSQVSFHNLFSIHDMPATYTPEDLDKFLERYRRRYDRTKELVENQPSHFLYRERSDCVLTAEEVNRLVQLLKSQNPEHKLSILGHLSGPYRINVRQFQTDFEGVDNWEEKKINWPSLFRMLKTKI